jgi:hypothetical protein
MVVAALSEVRNVFSRWNSGVVGSNPARGMDGCLLLFCVYIDLRT